MPKQTKNMKCIRVRFAADCPPCEECGEPWCPECKKHYADCKCVGPHNAEDLGYTLQTRRGVLYAVRTETKKGRTK